MEQTCCSEACDGECVSCVGSKTGKESGSCAPVLEGTDPKGKCEAGDSGAVCPADGMCDGKGQCRQSAKEGTACGATTCVGSSVAGSVCDAQGKCVKSEGTSCGAYACQNDKCATSCVTKNDCAKGFRCDGGVCVELTVNGKACSGAEQCDSGFCVDGVCCNAPCLETCASCATLGKLGECAPVTSKKPSGQGKSCPGEGACVGFCDGVSADCILPAQGETCGVSSCANGVEQPASVCDGAGQCQVLPTKDCGGFACDSTKGVCKTSCSGDDDCVTGASCNKATNVCTSGGASCVDDFTAKTASGTLVPCKGRCLAGQCQESCGTSSDCAKGYSCLNNTCVSNSNGAGGQGGANNSGGAPAAPASVASEEGGCGCSTPGQRTPSRGLAVMFALGLALSRRRRGQASLAS